MLVYQCLDYSARRFLVCLSDQILRCVREKYRLHECSRAGRCHRVSGSRFRKFLMGLVFRLPHGLVGLGGVILPDAAVVDGA